MEIQELIPVRVIRGHDRNGNPRVRCISYDHKKSYKPSYKESREEGMENAARKFADTYLHHGGLHTVSKGWLSDTEMVVMVVPPHLRRYLWQDSYFNTLELMRADIDAIHQPGDASLAVAAAMEKRYIKVQLDDVDPDSLRKSLDQYGAWSDNELKSHTENLARMVWIAACDLGDELASGELK